MFVIPNGAESAVRYLLSPVAATLQIVTQTKQVTRLVSGEQAKRAEGDLLLPSAGDSMQRPSRHPPPIGKNSSASVAIRRK